ncbi:MAG: TolC family protein, partial [bacterium]
SHAKERVSIDIALERRLGLATAKEQLEDASRRLHIARNSLLPRADVYFAAGSSGSSDSLIGGDRANVVSGGVELDIPLDKRESKEAVKRAEREEAAANRAVTETIDNIKVAISKSISELVALERTVDIEDKNNELAGRRLDHTMLRFKSGELSNRDVVEAQSELLAARNARVRAIVNYEIQRLQLLRDSGLLDVAVDGELLELPLPETAGR